ncbi:YeeE/YedE family protein [uncultured Rhodoblastus sp.]|uniref:YeeE/YedE family protein n=1 Tax=uncultured Rhodoblastus sp. TaxID=543037 RepID=UPI0025CDEBD5|nr:YeeE/YedE family protein [uncultured Rhodoblastus sp.]
MQIDWVHFTPWSALAGGVLIGLAAAWMLLVEGRILGASGIIGGLLTPRRGDIFWRAALILGLVASPALAHLLFGTVGAGVSAGLPMLIAAGLLVGFGSRLGKGCTSGHGVCGLARLSPRSAVATGAFMASGFLTVFIIRHLLS